MERWKELIGPKTVEEAYASHPDRYCLHYGFLSFPMQFSLISFEFYDTGSTVFL